MNKNYNTERKKLQLPEYGRHIHEMVDYLSTVDDRAERNRQAVAVIGVMGNLFPLLRDTADYTHKLWDHLFIMADFNLDVDSPYPTPSAEQLAPRPEKMNYPTRRITIKHYGKHMEAMLRSLSGATDAAQIAPLVENIARLMRSKGFEFNEEHPNNEAIIRDIKRMAGGHIAIDEAALEGLRSEYRPAQQTHYKTNGRKLHGEHSPRSERSFDRGTERNGERTDRSFDRNGERTDRRSHGDRKPTHRRSVK